MRIDLHCHSTASDGRHSVQDLITKAQQARVSHLALTDHDSTANVEACSRMAQAAGITFYPALELSTLWQGKSVHLLAYFHGEDYKNQRLQDLLKNFKEQRISRALGMKQLLQKHFHLDLPIQSALDEHGGSFGRPHIAKLLNQHYGIPLEEAFQTYIGKDSPAYLPATDLCTKEAIQFLTEIGATVILAHPGLIKVPTQDLLDHGVHGLECFYPEHGPEETAHFSTLAKKHHKFISVGSDDHGIPMDPKHGLLGQTPYEEDLIRPFLDHLNNNG